MEKIPQGKYTKEFQEEAAEMVTEHGLSIPGAGRRPSIPESTIADRVRSTKGGTSVKSKKSVTGEEMELARLKREIAGLGI